MVRRLQWNEETRALWRESLKTNDLQAPFLSYEWHHTWHSHLGQDYGAYLLYDQESAVLAPFARTRNHVIFSGGYEVADYLDVIGPNEAKQRAWKNCFRFLKDSDVRLIELRNIPQSSQTVAFLKSLSSTQAHIVQEDTTPIIRLPKTWGEYVARLSQKNRHELRRKMRKFESEHPAVQCTIQTGDEADIDTLIRLMKRDPRKRKFLTPSVASFFESIPSIVGKDLLTFTLTSSGSVVAAVLAFYADGKLLTYNSGFDEHGFPGAGFYLKARTIAYVIEQGYNEYNFLQGSEAYKYDLGATDFFVYKATISL